jgi:ABC-2 type transport system ATP-binding protein
MLEIINVSKSFPGKEAIKNINVSITKGAVLGLVGPNGAGKSTLLRTIVNIYTADSGEVKINGENVKNNHEVKKLIGYVADRNDYFNSYKIKDIVKYYKLAYREFDEKRFHEINEIFQIPLKQRLEKLSKGNASRVFFMLAMSQRPELLVLDEPTSGLDPIIKRKFLKLLLEDVYERSTTVIISSHNLSDLESICDHVVFLDNGEIVKDSSLDNLKTTMKKLQIIFSDNPPEDFINWKEFIRVDKVGRSYNVVTAEYNEALTTKLRESGAMFIEELDLSLEDMLIYTVER